MSTFKIDADFERQPQPVAQHQPNGSVRPLEAVEWAWSLAPLPTDQMIVLQYIASHVHVMAGEELNALPRLTGLKPRRVTEVLLLLVGNKLVCPSPHGGVHVALDCHCP